MATKANSKINKSFRSTEHQHLCHFPTLLIIFHVFSVICSPFYSQAHCISRYTEYKNNINYCYLENIWQKKEKKSHLFLLVVGNYCY